MPASLDRGCHTQDALQRKEVRELVVELNRGFPRRLPSGPLLRDGAKAARKRQEPLRVTEGAIKVRLHQARAAFKVLVAPVLSL